MPEMVHRLRHAVQAQWERRGLGLARPVEPREALGQPWLVQLPQRFDVPAYIEAADRVLAGRFDVFALPDRVLGFPPEWNRDPKTGSLAPLVFGKTLNYRDERIVGDIKYLWEPNRHAELVTLAQAFHLSAEEKYAAGCRALLESWIDQCPYPLGVNWTSSLEHGVRLVNWAVAWGLLESGARAVGRHGSIGLRDARDGVGWRPRLFLGETGLGFERRWLDAIYQHCHFINGHLSRHSSANNHLLGELMGLFVASIVWPCWRESQQWRESARLGFEAEALKQTAPDGVNREQATWYHHEVADMMLLVGLFGRANGIEFSAAYWRRLERMLEFVAALMDVNGNAPMIGDSDDARLVHLDPRPEPQVYRSLLASGAVLFKRGDFKAKAGAFDDKSRWLLGDEAFEQFEALPATEAAPRRRFPEGGYWLLGDRFGESREVRIVADAGPLGYLSIAAHGHADALSFCLSVAGQEMLIDPGTFAYHTQKAWRDYFRGTSAHNTLRVDGLDQSVIGGNFLWLNHARARCVDWQPGEKQDYWVAEHDGYRRLPDPVTHRRVIEFDKRAHRILVTDTLDCVREHDLELFWHFAEDCEVSQTEGIVLARKQRVGLKISCPPGLELRLISGQDSPPLGWVSRRFDEKCPCVTAVARGRGGAGWNGRTTIDILINEEIRS